MPKANKINLNILATNIGNAETRKLIEVKMLKLFSLKLSKQGKGIHPIKDTYLEFLEYFSSNFKLKKCS